MSNECRYRGITISVHPFPQPGYHIVIHKEVKSFHGSNIRMLCVQW